MLYVNKWFYFAGILRAGAQRGAGGAPVGPREAEVRWDAHHHRLHPDPPLLPPQ